MYRSTPAFPIARLQRAGPHERLRSACAALGLTSVARGLTLSLDSLRSHIVDGEFVIAEPEVPLAQPRSRLPATPTDLFDDGCAPVRGNDAGQIFEIETLAAALVVGPDGFRGEPPRSRTPFEIAPTRMRWPWTYTRSKNRATVNGEPIRGCRLLGADHSARRP